MIYEGVITQLNATLGDTLACCSRRGAVADSHVRATCKNLLETCPELHVCASRTSPDAPVSTRPLTNCRCPSAAPARSRARSPPPPPIYLDPSS